MNEALCSILSGDEDWHFDSEGKSIKFNNDGTGELECRCNLNYWILAEFEWHRVQPREVEFGQSLATLRHTSTTKHDSTQPELLGQLDLEITLTSKLPARARLWAEANPSTTENMNKNLTDDAYRTKLYTIRIERGNFIPPCYTSYQYQDAQRYSLRLIFDKSPYPPRSEWKTALEGVVEQGGFWEIVEFVSRPAPDSARRQKPMNGPSASTWGSCIVS